MHRALSAAFLDSTALIADEEAARYSRSSTLGFRLVRLGSWARYCLSSWNALWQPSVHQNGSTLWSVLKKGGRSTERERNLLRVARCPINLCTSQALRGGCIFWMAFIFFVVGLDTSFGHEEPQELVRLYFEGAFLGI